MDAKAIIDAIIELPGVYGAFFASHKTKSIVAKVPQDYPPKILQSMAMQGDEILEHLRQEVPRCEEVRMDMGHITVLMFLMTDGIMYAMVYKQEAMEPVRNAVKGIHTEAELARRKSMLLTARIQREEVKQEKSKAPPAAPHIPKILDPDVRYDDEVEIGEGGTAVIFKAYDTKLKRMIALKRFKNNESNVIKDKDDYLCELESASRIHHHNVVSTYDADVDDRGRFMVMELIKGLDLEQSLKDEPLSVKRFPDFVIQSIDGLQATHNGGLLHLDLKPSNIMISKQASGRDHIKLIDYGRAHVFSEDDSSKNPKGRGLQGSIYFSSPEFLNEEVLDERADLYSLGCVFYWALSGKRPFDGDNALMVMSAHLQHQVEDIHDLVPDLSKELADWIMSLISNDPKDRPRNTLEALETFSKAAPADPYLSPPKP
ncbi:serine/threonine protein kinase [Akkermansiaceae bacterium]|nr:serine/threonine protein kinase [Akkermansiaceae bacterium]